MKKVIIVIVLLALIATMFAACKKPRTPVVQEEELITTVQLHVTDSNGVTSEFTYKVQNGFGSTTQGVLQIDSVMLHPNSVYTYEVMLFDESVTMINITGEVTSEKDKHLFLFESNPVSGAGAIMQSDGSKDNNSLPFNQTGKFQTGDAGQGTFTVSLMHEPTDKNATTPSGSGGETDAQAVFQVVLE